MSNSDFNITLRGESLFVVQGLHKALDKKDMDDAIIKDVQVHTCLRDKDVSYQDPETLETVFHKCAKMPFSRLLQRHVISLLSLNCGAVLQKDRHGAPPVLVAIYHGSVWLLETIWHEYAAEVNSDSSESLVLREPEVEEWLRVRLAILSLKLHQSVTYEGTVFNKGSNLLHMAVLAKKPDVIKFLLKIPSMQFRPFDKDESGNTPVNLAYARRHEVPDVLVSFTAYKGIISELLDKANIDLVESLECLKHLLDVGADVNGTSPGAKGLMPLYIAARDGSEEAVSALIDRGADVNRRNAHTSYVRRYDLNNATALHVAVDGAHVGITRTLIAAGADVNVVDHISVTPLSVVCRAISSPGVAHDPPRGKRLRHCILLLARAGCRLDIKDSFSRTPVNQLAYNLPPHFDAIKMLLALGDVITPHGPVHRQQVTQEKILRNGPDTVRFILESGYTFTCLDALKLVANSVVTESIDELISTPLTLQRLAANVIRRRLRPNALVGVKKLSLPPAFNRNFILLDVFLGEDREHH